MAKPLPWDEDQGDLMADPAEVIPPAPPSGLHPAQQQVFDNLARFNVVAAGRRFGKSYFAVKLACYFARMSHWEDGTSLKGANVWYVSPTMDLATETIAPMILEELGDECKQYHKVQQYFLLENGCRIYLKSANRPENLRGRALRFAVLDEISIMPSGIWETIIRAMLVDVVGKALIIGTPVGKGKLFELFELARNSSPPTWMAWRFLTLDNPHISKDEVAAAGQSMNKAQFMQEFNADFKTGGGNVFKATQLKALQWGRGRYQMAAVFGSDAPYAADALAVSGTESALVTILMHPTGWHIVSAQRGFWSVTETIERISKGWKEYRPTYLALSDRDYKASFNLFQEYARHGGARPQLFAVQEAGDIDRIKWALQSRLKKGAITCTNGKPLLAMRDQLQDFPLEYSNNELVQALSYFDQLPQPNFGRGSRQRFHALDAIAGY